MPKVGEKYFYISFDSRLFSIDVVTQIDVEKDEIYFQEHWLSGGVVLPSSGLGSNFLKHRILISDNNVICYLLGIGGI